MTKPAQFHQKLTERFYRHPDATKWHRETTHGKRTTLSKETSDLDIAFDDGTTDDAFLQLLK
jgi:hypothetical protein